MEVHREILEIFRGRESLRTCDIAKILEGRVCNSLEFVKRKLSDLCKEDLLWNDESSSLYEITPRGLEELRDSREIYIQRKELYQDGKVCKDGRDQISVPRVTLGDDAESYNQGEGIYISRPSPLRLHYAAIVELFHDEKTTHLYPVSADLGYILAVLENLGISAMSHNLEIDIEGQHVELTRESLAMVYSEFSLRIPIVKIYAETIRIPTRNLYLQNLIPNTCPLIGHKIEGSTPAVLDRIVGKNDVVPASPAIHTRGREVPGCTGLKKNSPGKCIEAEYPDWHEKLMGLLRNKDMFLAELICQVDRPKGEINRHLYTLQRNGQLKKMIESPPKWSIVG